MPVSRKQTRTKGKLKPRGRPFVPGQAGGPGRKKGIPNKATREIRAAAQGLLESPTYVQALQARLEAGTAGAVEALLYHYAYGKPKETVAHEGLEPAKLAVVSITSRGEMQALLGIPDIDAGPDLDDDE